eukprot:3418684-Amphidinium_carterae.1
MDPPPDVAEAMETIAEAAIWVGFLEPVRDTLMVALGADPAMHPRVIACMPHTDFQDVVDKGWSLN